MEAARDSSGKPRVSYFPARCAKRSSPGVLLGVPRTATVTVSSDWAEVLEISRDNFMDLIRHSDLVSREIAAIARKRTATNLVREALPKLSAEAVSRVLPEFQTETWRPGEKIIQEGDGPESFYVIAEGTVVVTRRVSDRSEEELARLGVGEYFGEIGLLTERTRTATVTVAKESSAKLLSINRRGFRAILDGGGRVAEDLAQTMLRRVAHFSPNPEK